MTERVISTGIQENALGRNRFQPNGRPFSHEPDQGRSARTKEKDGVFDLLGYVFGDLPQDELTELFQIVGEGLQGSEGHERAKLTNVLFKTPDSSKFSQDIDSMRIQVDMIPDLLLNEGVFSLTSAMLQQRDRFNLQLGIILSQISLDQIPDDYKERLKPHKTGLELNLETSHESWHLCTTAENKLNKAIDEQAVMALGEKDNPHLLLKFHGKLSALCFEDFATKDGKVFLRGNWYSPTDVHTRAELRKDFDNSRGTVTLSKGDWALMRPYKAIAGDDIEEFLDIARQIAWNIPEEYHYPGEIISGGATLARSVYRRAYEESES